MRWTFLVCASLTALLAAAVAVDAQEIPPPRPYAPQPSAASMRSPSVETESPPGEPTGGPAPAPSSAGYGLEAESLPGELTEDIAWRHRRAQAGPDPRLGSKFLDGQSGFEEPGRRPLAFGRSAGSRAATLARQLAPACSRSSPARTASATSSYSTRLATWSRSRSSRMFSILAS